MITEPTDVERTSNGTKKRPTFGVPTPALVANSGGRKPLPSTSSQSGGGDTAKPSQVGGRNPLASTSSQSSLNGPRSILKPNAGI